MESLRHGPAFFRRWITHHGHLDYIDSVKSDSNRVFELRLFHTLPGKVLELKSRFGPHGKGVVNPSLDAYKRKADVVNLLQQAVADGANLIQQQRCTGLDKTTKSPFGNKAVHNSYCWMFVVEHSGEHYGQLVAYYHANIMAPPQTRPR